ncbi:hypothetical protein [Arsenophonus nasoniae]|uniref:hypothetical protein n=1 Tax=Arsenophonus nasoniae TaxID=638 RepID=UPI00387A56BC
MCNDSERKNLALSNPSGAEYSVKDEKGTIIAQGRTPQGIILEKSEGSYFGKKIMKLR